MKKILFILVAILFYSILAPAKNVDSICKKSKLPSNEGKQIRDGFFSTTQQGEIPNINNMVSSLIIKPDFNQKLPSNKAFDVTVITSNLELGHFSNADNRYYSFSQCLNNKGQIKGHQHVTVQKINDKNPPDAKDFVFFAGLNKKPDNSGILSVSVNATSLLNPGLYRICVMSSSFSHQPLLMPIAKRGAQDDCIRIELVQNRC
ncbi:hypothetical protein [endosymbiont GvMRE of Glomus versiforme]|uniref:hypothetical protein n=1 Tax=endosymbiont GvMRE of Glomus versiforme TaxID=2039283 RepID=UPI000EF0470C|nr:hypothetical protein [endosymbiont GvMRE of Glomus versiforme]RHZ35426.1 Ribosomal protein s17 protein [endosymbiont GvMRE of Glomus versiforme]